MMSCHSFLWWEEARATVRRFGDTSLSETELETYSRQIVLDEIGYDGQLRLRTSVCLVGLGGQMGACLPQLRGTGFEAVLPLSVSKPRKLRVSLGRVS